MVSALGCERPLADALYELSATSTVREAIERKLRLGEKIGAPEIAPIVLEGRQRDPIT